MHPQVKDMLLKFLTKWLTKYDEAIKERNDNINNPSCQAHTRILNGIKDVIKAKLISHNLYNDDSSQGVMQIARNFVANATD